MNWWKKLKCRIRPRRPLKKETTFAIGGPVRWFAQPRCADELRQLLICAKRYKIPLSVIGAGSNILAGDKELRRIVARLGGDFKKVSFYAARMRCGSGLRLNQAILAAEKRGLAGLEFLAGIPGTIGGALVMNAGAWGRSIGDVVEQVRVMGRGGRIKVLQKKDIKFAYRSSGLEKYIILDAVFRLKITAAAEIKKKIAQYLKQRSATQDSSGPNAGCVFKNPGGGVSAGRLIDLCGLKGRLIGGAAVSTRHANFIINRGNARADDVLKLMRLAKRKVKNKFNIDLEPEIKIWR